MEKKTILIVEDNDASRKIARDVLVAWDYQVIEAADGRSGLEKINSEKPDLVLLDIQLPNVDGLTVTRRIRESNDQKIKKIPIVIMTSYAMTDDIIRGHQAGCDAYLTKPYNIKELKETIGRFLD